MSLTSPDNAVEELLKRVPSFAAARSQDESYISHDDDGPYLVYGDFARFLTELVMDKSPGAEKADVLEVSFKLLSELASSSNDELANIAVVGVFEELADCPDCIILAKKMLSKNAAKVFKRVLRGWI
ncbi:MAG: hypothetical protein L0312_30700 [Acidobacteria bacterium]|nr:hypothetical protein [Acidobacteriota bacterium]